MQRGISRRKALKQALGALAGVSSLASGCTRAVPVPMLAGIGEAKPVIVDSNRIIRTVVGLRPFRRTGFRVAAEPHGEKLVVHNYGHGGGGVTLSWGTAHLALELARQVSERSVAVIGSGAVGLATARLFQDAGFRVTIYARDLPPNTTSNIAGAQWAPVTVADEDARTVLFDRQLLDASRFAYRYFQLLAGPRYGVSWHDNYVFGESAAIGLPWELKHISDLLPMTMLRPREHPFGHYHALYFKTMLIEPSIYLPAVLAEYRAAGGQIVIREFLDRSSVLQVPERLIVNCTGLGAGHLFSDSDVIPIKGQLTFLYPQADVDYLTVGPGDLYMMPRHDGILLGGTHERGVSSLDPNPRDVTRIVEGHRRLFAEMG